LGASGREAAALNDYFRTVDAAAAEELLIDIVEQQAAPLIRRIVRAKFASRYESAHTDIEDVCSDAVVSLLSSLDQFRESGTENAIGDFDAFVAVIAYRACSNHFRRRYPEFHCLRNRLRYTLQNHRDLGIWQEDGDWLCGLQRWQPGQGRPVPAAVHPDDAQLTGGLKQGHRDDPGRLMSEIFRIAGGPLQFDTMVRVVAHWWGVVDSPETVEIDTLPVMDSAPLPDAGLEQRQWLQTLWAEILELPPRQRAALLLNLRDGSGSCATTVFVATGVAGLHQLAAALDMPVEEFAELWRDMPLDDLRIGERMGIARQQVINLRKCARERLARVFVRSRKEGGPAVIPREI
jgi:RNA polymerase sigma factor (sigma-70 family)